MTTYTQSGPLEPEEELPEYDLELVPSEDLIAELLVRSDHAVFIQYRHSLSDDEPQYQCFFTYPPNRDVLINLCGTAASQFHELPPAGVS